MKRMIKAARNFGDEKLMGHWTDGTEYEGDLTGLVQDVENHYNKAQLRNTPNAWREYKKWLDKTAAKFGGAFNDGDHLEQWAFDYSYNFQTLGKDYKL